MPSVKVELDDLEAIIFAAAAIKNIEGALATRQQDPFVKPHLEFTAAHDRLAAAWRNAKREIASDTLIKYNDPLTKEEIGALLYVSKALDGRRDGPMHYFVISPEDKGEPGVSMSVYDKLAAKGCIEMGQCVTGVVWTGAPTADVVVDPKGYAAKLTARGRDKLAEINGTK